MLADIYAEMQNALDRNALVADDQSRLHMAHAVRAYSGTERRPCRLGILPVAIPPAGRTIGLVVNI